MPVYLLPKDFPAFCIYRNKKGSNPFAQGRALKSEKGFSKMRSENNKKLELIPTKHSHIFNVKLNLEFQSRFIGVLDTSGSGKFISERKEKHLFRKTNSLGLCEELLVSPEIHFNQIILNFRGQKFITTRTYFLTHSKVFTFQSFEKQYFLSLDEFGIDKAEHYEKSISKQLSLFGEAA